MARPLTPVRSLEHVMNLPIHLRQRLLHVLDVDRGHIDQSIAMAQDRAQSSHLVLGVEGAAQ